MSLASLYTSTYTLIHKKSVVYIKRKKNQYKVSQSNPGRPESCYIDKVGLELPEIYLSLPFE